MIIFIDLDYQIYDDIKSFAFYDTIYDKFYSFGQFKDQVWNDVEEFIIACDEINCIDGMEEETIQSLERFISLIPDNFLIKKEK